MNDNRNDWLEDQEENLSEKSNGFHISIDDEKLDEVLSSADEFDESLIESVDEEERSEEDYRPRMPRGPRRRSDQPAPRKRRKKNNGCLYKMIYFIAICVVSVIISQILISGVNDMLAAHREDREATVVIPEDATVESVATMLEEQGLISNKWFYTLYSNLTHATYRFGTYALNANMDYEALNTYMSSNLKRTDIVKVTFPEGFNTQQIAKRLEESEVCKADAFIEAVNTAKLDSEYVKGITDASDRIYRLEGYLFPDTYEFYKNEDPVTVVKKFINEGFRARITAEILDQAEKLEMTIDQVLTLASIIQKESGDPSDMKKISGVFHNRLKPNSLGIRMLQSDPTFWYPYANEKSTPTNLVEEIRAADGGKYSTYKVEGLPMGPICNPGLDAIRAALNPDQHSYLFFVNDVNGKFYFATSQWQHDQNIAFTKTVKKEVNSEDEEELVNELADDDTEE